VSLGAGIFLFSTPLSKQKMPSLQDESILF